ncbi:MAG: sigma-70 family RNA polymerase sigma factor [Ruminococcaceae bacterium]|nr:sigma-70 family RNA polymerase sigma factor [Oscillospiraceae bacterium]
MNPFAALHTWIGTLKSKLFRWRVRTARGIKKQKGLFYINGPDVLPHPLPPEVEAEYIARLSDEDARTKLIEHNLRLVVYIAKRFENTGTGIEDLISIGTMGLIKAVNTFRPDKSIKLATYASRCIENEILMYIRKNSGQRCEISLDEPLNVDFEGNEFLLSDILGNEEDGVSYRLEQREEKKMVRDAVATLEPRERELIELRYGMRTGNEMTQKEVADLLGISQSYISRLEKRILSNLRRQLSGKL